jgi:hypothetical protein
MGIKKAGHTKTNYFKNIQSNNDISSTVMLLKNYQQFPSILFKLWSLEIKLYTTFY